MRYSTWIGVGSVLLLALACTMPWVLIPSKQLVISGIDASGTRYGKPGYLHLLLGFFYYCSVVIRVAQCRERIADKSLDFLYVH